MAKMARIERGKMVAKTTERRRARGGSHGRLFC
jgi:hypothetical protein